MIPSHPLAGLDRAALTRAIVVCGVAFVIVGAAMWWLDLGLSDRGAGIVELELAGADRSAEIVADWGPSGCDADGFDCAVGDITWRAKASVLLDFVWLVAYGLGAAAILGLLADGGRERRPRRARLLDLLAWAMLVAAVADAIENAALWRVLSLHYDGWAEAATAFAVVKFSLVGVVLVATPVVLVGGGRGSDLSHS